VERATRALNTGVFRSPGIDAEAARALVATVARLRKDAGDFTDPRPVPDPLCTTRRRHDPHAGVPAPFRLQGAPPRQTVARRTCETGSSPLTVTQPSAR